MLKWYDYDIDVNDHNDTNNNSDNDNNDNSITIIMIQFHWNRFTYPTEKKDRNFERKEEEMAYLNACKEWFPHSFWGRPHVFRGSCKHCRDIAWYLLTKQVKE